MSEPYSLAVDGFAPEQFRVHAFTGREAISEAYAFDVVVTSDFSGEEEIERDVLGRRAVFTWTIGAGRRVFHGLVVAAELVEVHEAAPRSVRHRLRFVPRLWLLERKRRSRIFQHMRVRDIVDAVLAEVGIATRWTLFREDPVREYCTQYEESDYHFVTRLLAESGTYFYFAEGSSSEGAGLAKGTLIPGDSVLLGNDPSAYRPLGTGKEAGSPGGAATPLYYLSMQQTSASHADKITRFSCRSRLRADTATFRDYDPERPMARLHSSAGATPALAGLKADGPAAGGSPGLEVYEHHGVFLFPDWAYATAEAQRILQQERRGVDVASGESGCPHLAPGHRFALEDHPAAHLNRDYAVVSVEHVGEVLPRSDIDPRQYRCTFRCVPASVAYIPARPRRQCVQVALTATVVGPPSEEIHVDEKGQIKVQFHWDREGVGDERSSCWIRAMQAWGGAGWGAQLLPRVGMEVVVVFEGGDLDKPMILGSLYNGTHPMPFALPRDKTRSGWRTRSTPGGRGHNELSFDDAAGLEQIYVHAQRDLDETVERNHTLLARGDESLRVLGNRVDVVEGSASAKVGGALEAKVTGDQATHVEGNRVDVVLGNADERVSGASLTRVEGSERREVQEKANHVYADDVTMRVLGNMTSIVGKGEHKRSWVTHAEGAAKLSSKDTTEISSEGELVLRVGKSWIRITEDRIELSSPAIAAKGEGASLVVDDAGLALSSKEDAQLLVEKKLVIRTKDGASVAMGKEVKIDGSKILMNSPEQAKDPPAKEPDPPTKVAVADQDGNPLPHQRFVIKHADGSETGGTTGEDGKAELALKTGGDIVFPGLTLTDDKSGTDDMRPHVIRRGDFLVKLAGALGFDVDEVWSHAKNDDVRALRKKHNILAEGDLVFVPASPKKGLPCKRAEENKYTVKVPRVSIKLTLRYDGEAVADEKYEILGLEGVPPGTTGADGGFEVSVPSHLQTIDVRVPERGLSFHLGIGHMDPISEISGVRARLENIGQLVRRAVRSDDDKDLRDALSRFQKSVDLPVTGEIDQPTEDALLREHGS